MDAFPTPPFVLLDDASSPEGGVLLFHSPLREIRADGALQVDQALAALDEANAKGLYAAGYLAYELGYALEQKLEHLLPGDHSPLIRMHVFERPTALDAASARRLFSAAAANAALRPQSSATRIDHARAFDTVHRYILDGDAYQVNLTFPLRFEFEGDPAALYASTRGRARANASALLRYEDLAILSFSPEIFFRIDRGTIRTRPMKGTSARGLSFAGDIAAKRALRNDGKQRAENLMIVDLMRNDLSRVCQTGSVRMRDLLSVETFPNLHTMTSGVEGRLRGDVKFSGIVRAMFPCGSITGAPKFRAMEIIREVEKTPRGVYCGAIGYAGPSCAAFNVAIRTLTIEGEKAVFGVGGGIVADSTADMEYDECLLKARFLTQRDEDFSLLETIRWEKDRGFALLDRHEERLAESAQYFGFPFDPIALRSVLEAAAARPGLERARIRLTLDRGGRLMAQAFALEPAPKIWRFVVWPEPIDSKDRFLHHKTTKRAVYDNALRDAKEDFGADEVVFLNERGEIADGARSTVFIVRDGAIVTPALSAGALNGCLRRALFDDPDFPIREETLYPRDLLSAESIWFGNSLRGLVKGVRVE
jgi:para-aminobenzoate synthetase/4-amino-4-deoxychorismate lyase